MELVPPRQGETRRGGSQSYPQEQALLPVEAQGRGGGKIQSKSTAGGSRVS